ncbi:MAG: amphi-Trp domain-containing protein [Candidatus Hydrothermarchaeota archaeon]|nr:amphi-Trp domain-containing protein [Candidatus Hydrothermarchaeota archaeon]
MEYEERKTMDRKELSELLEKLRAGVERGAIDFRRNRIELPEQMEVEIEYKEKHGRKKFEVELKWA